MIPPIEPYIKDLKFRFNATGMVRMPENLNKSVSHLHACMGQPDEDWGWDIFTSQCQCVRK